MRLCPASEARGGKQRKERPKGGERDEGRRGGQVKKERLNGVNSLHERIF